MAAPLTKAFNALDARLLTLQNAPDLADAARADLAVKRVVLLAAQFSHVRHADADAALKAFADARKVVETVEDPQERDYLRRILLASGQDALNAAGIVKPSAAATAAFDDLLAAIDDEDERQNALYVRFKAIAASLNLVDDYPAVRANLMERVEELDDLRQYEEIVGRVYAADQLLGASKDEDDDPLVTPTGLALQYDGGLMAFLAGAATLPAATLAAASANAAEVLVNLEKTLDTGVLAFSDDEEELDEDEIDDLRGEAREIAFSAPTILAHADVVLGFARRNDAFDAAANLVPLYDAALGAPGSELYPLSASEYESGLASALDAASELARGNAKRLVRLADLAFKGKNATATLKESGKASVREALGVMAKPTRGGEFVEEFASLVQTHLDVGMTGPARKLAEKLLASLEGFDFIAEHEFHTARFFNMFLTLFADDPDRIDSIVYRQEATTGQQTLEARVDAADAIANAGDDPDAIDDAVVNILDRVFPDYNAAPDADPLLAADKILAFARDVCGLL